MGVGGCGCVGVGGCGCVCVCVNSVLWVKCGTMFGARS